MQYLKYEPRVAEEARGIKSTQGARQALPHYSTTTFQLLCIISLHSIDRPRNFKQTDDAYQGSNPVWSELRDSLMSSMPLHGPKGGRNL